MGHERPCQEVLCSAVIIHFISSRIIFPLNACVSDLLRMCEPPLPAVECSRSRLTQRTPLQLSGLLPGELFHAAAGFRLQAVLDGQLASLKAFNLASFAEVVKLHPVTQRYATLTASMLLLNSDLQVAIHFSRSGREVM